MLNVYTFQRITSYSYQFNGEKAENRSPFRPRSKLAKPKGLIFKMSQWNGALYYR